METTQTVEQQIAEVRHLVNSANIMLNSDAGDRVRAIWRLVDAAGIMIDLANSEYAIAGGIGSDGNPTGRGYCIRKIA